MNATNEEVSIDSVERLATMSIEEVDELPYGFLILDRDGRIQLYNRYESRMSRLAPERVVGRSWFSDVAPCTRVDAFQGRFRRMVDDPTVATDRFAFRFHFLHGAQDVIVQLSRAPGDDGSIFMTVVRRNMTGPDVRRPAALTLDEDRGALVGPAGIALAIPATSLVPLLDRLEGDAARALGEEVGTSLAIAADREARQAGEGELGAAPMLLRSGVLDLALCRAGLGRVALDLTAFEGTGAIGILLRPPCAVVSRGLVVFFEGLLATAIGTAIGEATVARCLDEDPRKLPWLFAAVAQSRRAILDALPPGSPRSRTSALGLFLDADGDERR
jgi:photoactive yellow protein